MSRGTRVTRLLPALRFAASCVAPAPSQWWTEAPGFAMTPERGAPVKFYIGSEPMETATGVVLSLREQLLKEGVHFRANLTTAQARHLALRLLEDANESEELNARQAARLASG